MSASSDPYDLDLFAPEMLLDPYRVYARLRANRWIHYRCPTGLCSVLSRYTDVQLALTDPRFIRVAAVDEDLAAADELGSVDHMVAALLEPLTQRASFDLIADFAQPLGQRLRHPLLAAIVGNAALALMTHRDQLALLRHMAPVTAVDELLRFDSPKQRTLRKVVAEVELPEGDIILEGEIVMVLIGAANRDHQQFFEPDQLKLDRRNAVRHLAFGAELQPDITASQVRHAATIAITCLFATFPELRLMDAAPRRGTTFDLRRLEALRILNGAHSRLVERSVTTCQPG